MKKIIVILVVIVIIVLAALVVSNGKGTSALRVYSESGDDILITSTAIINWSDIEDVPDRTSVSFKLLNAKDNELGAILDGPHGLDFADKGSKEWFIDKYSTGSEIDGNHQFVDITPGIYKVKINLDNHPANYKLDVTSDSFEIKNGVENPTDAVNKDIQRTNAAYESENWTTYTNKEKCYSISYPDSVYGAEEDGDLVGENDVKIQVQEDKMEFGQSPEVFKNFLNNRIIGDLTEGEETTLESFVSGYILYSNKVLSGPGGVFHKFYAFFDEDSVYYRILVWNLENDKDTVEAILKSFKPTECPFKVVIESNIKRVTRNQTEDNLIPGTITEVSGPATIRADELGTWQVKIVYPNRNGLGNTSFFVIWGDEDSSPSIPKEYLGPNNTSGADNVAKFIHTYSKKGVFEPKFISITKDNQISEIDFRVEINPSI